MCRIKTGNLGGTLYCGNIKLCAFKMQHSRLVPESVVVYNDSAALRPLVMESYHTTDAWLRFADLQIIEPSRVNLIEDWSFFYPVYKFVPEQFLRLSKCRNVANDYWVVCDDDLSCWEPWQIEELRERNYMVGNYIDTDRTDPTIPPNVDLCNLQKYPRRKRPI